MKKQFNLSVGTPCSENWNNFKPTLTGGFCQSCQKNVTDFTKKSEREVIDFFSGNPENICGRFYPKQLKTYSYQTSPVILPGLRLFLFGLLTLFLMFGSISSFAKTPEIKTETELVEVKTASKKDVNMIIDNGLLIEGIVVDENNHEPIPGINVYLKGTEVGTVTDIDGKFVFPQNLAEGDVLIFSYIGFETIEYVVPEKAPQTLQIQMEMYEVLMGEVLIDVPYKSK